MKILYAASNNQNAQIQLERFLKAIQHQRHTIKIAAFKRSAPHNVSVDWTLDCLLNMFKPEHISLDNDNLRTYYEQVKYFNPDLIISDLEYFTSHVANLLNITLWQCSSSIINYALASKEKYNLGLFKRHAYTFNKNPLNVQRTINVLDNSNWNGVYSHLGDSRLPPTLKENYEWVRPYHEVGRITTPCRHNLVAGMTRVNVKILDMLAKHDDSVAFAYETSGEYQNIILKPLSNQEEYFCNLKNCNLFVCGGQTSFLADAFYNGKHAAVITDYTDAECILNSEISQNFGLSTNVHQIEDLIYVAAKRVSTSYSSKIKYLHEKLEEL